MNSKVVASAFLVILIGLCAARDARACGPYFTEVRYQDPGILDVPRSDVALGRYGVLRQGLPWADLLRVYRSLQGLPISMPEARAEFNPDNQEALKTWLDQRAKVLPNEAGPDVIRSYENAQFVTVYHVGDDALLKAAQTLSILLAKYGASPAVRDWVQAQDQVFASAPDSPHIPVPVQASAGLVHAPEWLVQEREYQIASAQFYSSQWDLAQEGFRRMAAEREHPRKAWGLYLAARCLVRKAESPIVTPADVEAARHSQEQAAAGLRVAVRKLPEANEATKLSCYREAQALLQEMLQDPGNASVHRAARQYLELVRYRTEPLTLLADLLRDQCLAEPVSGNLVDTKIGDALNFLPKDRKGEPAPVAVPGDSDLANWLGAMAGHLPWHVDAEMALTRWRAHPSDAWLVAVLSLAQHPSPALEPALAAARKIPRQSPLFPTTRWHLLRLELSGLGGKTLALRIERALRRGSLPPWAVNQLRATRQGLAQDAATWLSFASRKPTATVDGELQIPGRDTPAELFDEGTARALTEQVPLQQVVPLLKAARLPSMGSQEFAKAAWTKAVLLEQWDQARSLVEFLPPSLHAPATKALSSAENDALRFQTAVLVMDWPGLRPTVEFDLGRQYVGPAAGVSPLMKFDMLRDNWWCGPDVDKPEWNSGKQAPAPVHIPGLSQADQATAAEETRLLAKVASAQLWFGRSVLAFAKSHPDDDRVPHALHRFVWTIRSPRCLSKDAQTLGQEAFRRLHKLYPKSPWTKKTPYYF